MGVSGKMRWYARGVRYIRPIAVADRLVMDLEETSTMEGTPAGSTWVSLEVEVEYGSLR